MMIKNWHIFLLLSSIIAISSALVAEHYYNLQPCELCLKQRHPYYAIILLSLFLFSIPKNYSIVAYLLIQISSIYGFFYAAWHVGVENNFLKGPSGCSARLDISSETIELKAQILSNQVVSCNEVVWSFYGLSAASINTVIFLFIFIINAIYIYNYHGPKKEK